MEEIEIKENSQQQADISYLIPPADRWKFFCKNVGIHILFVLTVFGLICYLFPLLFQLLLKDSNSFIFRYYIHFIVPLILFIYTIFQWIAFRNYCIPKKWITHSIYASLIAFIISSPVLFFDSSYFSVKYVTFTNYSMAITLLLTVSAVCFVQSLLFSKIGIIDSWKWIVYIMFLFVWLLDRIISYYKNIDSLLQYQLPEWLISNFIFILVLLTFVGLQSMIIFSLKQNSITKSRIHLNLIIAVTMFIICFSVMHFIIDGLQDRADLFFRYHSLEIQW